MKLERYKDKKETRKRVILISLTVLTLISITMVLYKTFAKFTATTSFPIMSGKVKYKKKGQDLTEVVPPTTSGDSSGNGLFAVTPTGPSDEWKKPEYRYAGPNPNNYVYFNCSDLSNQNDTDCEKWRIIGLVNVKTSSGIQQRLKIIRNESLGNYAWDKDSNYTNDWTKSALKDMLNDGYYFQSSNTTCYKGQSNAWTSTASRSTCNFSATSNPKGLTSLAREMIDNNVIWNLGGWGSSQVTADAMYGYERGTTTYTGNALEWTEENDQTNHRGVGIMYPSDYGYAVGGTVREKCLSSQLRNYNYNGCGTNNWIYIGDRQYQWLLTPDSPFVNKTFYLHIQSYVDGMDTKYTYAVHPVVFLNLNIKLGEGKGTETEPYELTAS